MRFSICKSLRCKLYLFWPYSLLEVVSFFKKPLRCCLYPGNSLIDGDSIPVELPCVCLAPYFVKAGLISLLSPDDTLQRMFQVYPELSTRTIGQKELEQLASVTDFRVFGGIFSWKTYYFCCKGILFKLLLMAKHKGRYTMFLCKILTRNSSFQRL